MGLLKLPPGWEITPMGEAVNFIRGISWGKSDESDDGIPVIAIPNVGYDGINFDIRYKIKKKISHDKSLNYGDILLVGSSGSIHNVGRAAVVYEIPFPEITFASFLVKITPKSNLIDGSFLFFLLKSKLIDFSFCSKRAADGKFNLQVEDLRHFDIPIPPLPEQRAIAWALRAVQEAREARRRGAALERERKAALMDYLFTHGTRGEPRKHTEIGQIPQSWRIVTIGNVREKTEIMNPERNPEKYFNYVDVSSISNESFTVVETNKILGKDAPSRARKLIKTNDIIFATVRPTLKRIAIIPETLNNQICSTGFCVVRANPELIQPKYLFFYLLTERIIKQVEFLQKGATYPAISDSDIYGQLVPLPSLSEQKEISEVLSGVDTKISALEQEAAVLEELFRAMLEELMTGRLSALPLVEAERAA